MLVPLLRRAASQPWPLSDGFGNHRLLVFASACTYVQVEAEWRRRDANPETIGLRVKHLETGTEIRDVVIIESSRQWGRILFQAPYDGLYGIYYMPFVIEGAHWYTPHVRYMPREEMKPDATWLAAISQNPSKAVVLALESRTGFDLFTDMEIPATDEETKALCDANRDKPFLVFPEDRTNPIRMFSELPFKWICEGPKDQFSALAQSNEYYVFQIGVYALSNLTDLNVTFNSPDFDQNRLNCLNTQGQDWLGNPICKTLSAQKGEVLPLWIGVDLPPSTEADPPPEKLAFTVILQAQSQPSQTVNVSLSVSPENLPDRGDSDLWRLSRLRWLNSALGLDQSCPKPYIPLKVSHNRVELLGRAVDFDSNGWVSQISSYFSNNGELIDSPHSLLASPIRFQLTQGGLPLQLVPQQQNVNQTGEGTALVQSLLLGGGISLESKTLLEYDGHLETWTSLTADRDMALDNLELVIELPFDTARMMLGMGFEGGASPSEWEYRWDENRANNFLWVGKVSAGLMLKLKHNNEVWELYNFKKTGLPDGWHNGGKGGCSFRKPDQSKPASIRAFTGPLTLKKGQPLPLRYSLLITPLKPVNTDAHWEQRYHHIDTWGNAIPDLEEAKNGGATVVNLHQGGRLNPYINYPFHFSDSLSAQTRSAHEKGLKYKIYYTVRELTTHAAELFAVRALGGEILMDAPNFQIADHFTEKPGEPMTGGPWLCEHLTEGFVPAWQQLLPDGEYDCAVATVGLSRWHNYYLEGLSWLMRQNGFDGIYLDGVGYDRQIMKRVRKTIDAAKPGCLIDFHSGNNYNPLYGLANPMGQYLELMPSIDSLWMGEGYDYENTTPEYWLTEISGIPFGLMGDMLSGGGNKWRGMVFGMTPRMGWQQGGNPIPVWRFWERFGMQGSRMVGWWDDDSPLSVSDPMVKATLFLHPDRCLIAIASWNPRPSRVVLSMDFEQAGLPIGLSCTIPAIEEYQDAMDYVLGQSITVQPNMGVLIVLS